MGNTIRDSGGLKYLEMQNGRIARKPIAAAFDSWVTIRICLRVDLDSVSSVTPTAFFFGLCSGTTNIPGDTTPTNAVGCRTDVSSTLTYSNTGADARRFWGVFSAYKNVGGVQTAGTQFSSNVHGFNSSASSTGPGAFFVTITKGSPNYSLDIFAVNTSAAICSTATFQSQSILASPSLGGHSSSTGKTIAFSEVAGTIDTAFIYWSDAVLLRIFDWRVVRLA